MATSTYQPGDLTTYGTDGLLRQLADRRQQLAAERHDTVRITIQLMIDEIIAELDRRNQEILDRRSAR